MKNPQAVLQQLGEIRAGTLRRLDGLTQKHLDARPPQGDSEHAWSLGEVFMHLAIDEFYLRELIARPLLEGVKPPDGVRFLPPPPPYGTEKDVIQFWFERARARGNTTAWLSFSDVPPAVREDDVAAQQPARVLMGLLDSVLDAETR